ncbi:MAG: hypothetical protein ACMG6E_07435 [Candidatus Roizmanbacteria bacterium]
MVDKAFDILDRQGRGFVTFKDIYNTYDVSKDKDFVSGKKSKEQILIEFLNAFEGVKGNHDGAVSKQEFVDYYTDLAMSTPSDDYFVGVLESAWCITENEEDKVFLDKVREIVGLMRQRLLVISNNS